MSVMKTGTAAISPAWPASRNLRALATAWFWCYAVEGIRGPYRGFKSFRGFRDVGDFGRGSLRSGI